MESRALIHNDIYKFINLSSTWSDVVVIYISNEHFGNAGEKIKAEVMKRTSASFTMCELIVNDWDNYLTPWEAASNMKGRSFGGKANVLLQSIKNDVIPLIKENTKSAKIYIAGYSLAGLFSLWSLYEGDFFDGAACCSGSLWYPGWKEFTSKNKVTRTCDVYLSLGLGEKNTKHPLMKNVEDNMKYQYDSLKCDSSLNRLHIDWHEGGHFSNAEERTVMGVSWLIG